MLIILGVGYEHWFIILIVFQEEFDMSILKFMKKQMILIDLGIMIIAVLLGRYYHGFFVYLKVILPVALFMMLFKPMVYLDLTSLVKKKSSIKTKYIILLTIFHVLVFPATAFLLEKFFLLLMPGINSSLLAGLVVLALAPLATSAPAFVGLAGGKVQLSLVGVIYTFTLSFAVIPLYSKIILSSVVFVPVYTLLKSLLIYIIIPLALGQLTKYLVAKLKNKDALENLKAPLEGLSLIGVFLMVFIVFGINGKTIFKEPLFILYGAVIMNVYFFLRWSLAYLVGKLFSFPIEQNVSFTYSSSYNMTISTAIGIAVFGPMAAVGTVLGGPLSEMIQMILLVKFFQVRIERSKEKYRDEVSVKHIIPEDEVLQASSLRNL